MHKGRHKVRKAAQLWIFAEPPWPPPPLDMFEELFFLSPISSRQKFLKKFGFWSATPPVLGKCSNFSWKGSLWGLDLTSPAPPFLKNFQTQAEKGSLKSSLKAFDSCWTLLQQKSKVGLLFLPCAFPYAQKLYVLHYNRSTQLFSC